MFNQIEREFLIKLLKDQVDKLDKVSFELDMLMYKTTFQIEIENQVKDLEKQIKIANTILEKI